jgi:hypothetical protein
MSDPYGDQQPPQFQQPQQFQQSPPFQPTPPPPLYWQPYPPVRKQNNGLAIAGIVIGSLALLTGLGFVVSQLFFGVLMGGLMMSGNGPAGGGFLPPDGAFEGTAPQVVAGQTYPGALLQDEVARLVRANGGDVGSISCPATPAVGASVVATCHGVVDQSNWSFQVTFTDGLGHFTLDEKVD